MASILAGALAPIIALKMLGDVSSPNTTAAAVYMTVASVLTVVAVLMAKETARTSLRHDRTLDQEPAVSARPDSGDHR